MTLFFIKYFHVIFGFYVFIALFLWSLPRIFSYESMENFLRTTGINFQLILDHYRTQYVPHSPLIHKYSPVIFSIGIFLLCFVLPAFLNLYKRYVNFELTTVQTKPMSTRCIFGTGFFVVIYLLIKEIVDPYFFTQDDSHSQFFPKILVGLRLLFSGNIPFIDNYQHFGAPLFQIGTYAVFDPIMIFSYVLGNYILHKPFTTLEIYVILCMFGGAVFLGYSFRLLKVESLVSQAAIISFLFAGYFFITTRSWYYVGEIIFYLPLLLYFFVLALNGKLGLWWFFLSGLFRGLLFYAGNAQYFVYILLMEVVSYLYAAFNLKKGRVVFLQYLCSVILTLGLMLPLLVPQYLSLQNISRPTEGLIPSGTASFDALISSFLPYPFGWAPQPIGWGNKNTHLMPNMFHIGFVWVFTLFISLAVFIRTGKVYFAPVLVLAVILFFLTGGAVSLVYSFKSFVPVLNKMTGPFKGYPFPVFAVVLYGALVLNEIRKYILFRKLIAYPILFSVLVTMLVGMSGTSTAYYLYGDKPYPELSANFLKAISKNDILFSYAPWRYDEKGYVTSLPHNYSCIYDIMCVNHYDPLLPTEIGGPPPNPREYFDRLGVTKVIVFKINGSIEWQGELQNFLSGYPVVYEDEHVVLFSTGNEEWLFRQVEPSVIISNEVSPIEYNRARAKARLISSERSKWEYHNEYRDGYYLLVDGKRKKLFSSYNGWVLFELEPGVHNVEIGYFPPLFLASVLFSFLLILLSCGLYWLLFMPDYFKD